MNTPSMLSQLYTLAFVLILSAVLLSGVYCGAKKEAQQAQKEKTRADTTKIAEMDTAKTAGMDTTITAEGDTTTSGEADTAKAAGKGKSKKKVEKMPVKVAELQTGPVSSYLLFSSTVEAARTVDVYAQIVGLVEMVHAEEGDYVKKGDELVQLQDDELKLSVADAEVNLKRLMSKFKRIQEMYTQNLTSPQDYENARYELTQAEIGLEQAKLMLARSKIQAPISGTIAERFVGLGDRVVPQERLFVLADTDSLIARVFVPAREIHHLKVGQRAWTMSHLLADTTLSGRIERISPVVDPKSGTFSATLSLLNGKLQLKPGMFVTLQVIMDIHEEALLVPKDAIVYDDGLPFVFVVDDTTASKNLLSLGYSDKDHFEALEGVSQGDTIVVIGQDRLKDKSAIRVIEGESLIIPAEKDTTEQDTTQVDS